MGIIKTLLTCVPVKNTATFIKAHAPEILTIGSIALGGTAIGVAIAKTPKAVSLKEEYQVRKLEINRAHETGMTKSGETYSEEDYKKDNLQNNVNVAKDMVKTYAIPGALFVGSAACSLGSLGILKKRETTALAFGAASIAAYNRYRENVRLMSGTEADAQYALGRTFEKNENDEKVCTLIVDDNDNPVKNDDKNIALLPTDAYIDKDVADEMDRGRCAYPAGIYTIRIDERFPFYSGCNGDPYMVLTYITRAFHECQDKLWSEGKITVRDQLEALGVSKRRNRDDFDWDMAEKVGIIDYPVAYDYVTGKMVYIPGFDSESTKYGETSHKRISWGGIDFDAALDDICNGKSYGYPATVDADNGRQYVYLDMYCDGYIANLRLGDVLDTESRANLAAELRLAHPELER